MATFYRAAVAAFCVALFAGAANADDCKPLTRVSSLDMISDPDATFRVSAGIEGSQVGMYVDTASTFSELDDPTTKALGLLTANIFDGVVLDGSGKSIQKIATIHDLTLGGSDAKMVRVLVSRTPMSSDGSPVGLLGLDYLLHYDLELDFGAHKMNLFLSDHCPGVVYWPAAAVAAVPLQSTHSSFLSVSVTLDGKPIDAVVSTASCCSSLSSGAARMLFGLSPTSPGMTRVADNTYQYTFKSLELSGITMNNVPVTIYDSDMRLHARPDTGTRISGAPEVVFMTLGMHELKKLHLFFAFKQGVMYATPAAPTPVATAK